MTATGVAVLLLNYQNDYLKPQGLVHDVIRSDVTTGDTAAFLENTSRIVEVARRSGTPIVWVNTVLRSDGLDCALSPLITDKIGPIDQIRLLSEGTWGASNIDEMQPLPGDPVIVKKGHSAFQGTSLDRTLTNMNVHTCITVGGGLLDDIVQTLGEAGALGYEMIVPVDAVDPSASQHHAMWRARAAVTMTEQTLDHLESLELVEQSASQSALIVIDLQNDFVHPQGVKARLGYSRMSEEDRSILIEKNQELCQAMRAAGHPVIFARIGVRQDNLDRVWSLSVRRERPIAPEEGYLAEGSWGAQIVDGVDVEETDLFVTKKGNSAFGLTSLHRLLRNLRVRSAFISGGGIHGCVEATIREGVGLGYSFTLVEDASYPPGGLIPEVLAGQAEVKSTAEIIADLR